MVMTPSGMVMAVNDQQLRKALLPSSIRDAGRVMEVRAVQQLNC